VADFENDTYVRLLFDDTAYDLSAYTLETAADTTPPSQQPLLEFYGNLGDNDYCLLGSAIITVGEP
jgi:hypothetical protein